VEEEMTFGQFTLIKINEGNKSIEFVEPLLIKWDSSYDESEKVTRVHIDFDFGMIYEIRPYCSISLGWLYDNINTDTSIEDIIKSFVKYDLFHSFFHCQFDPNYTIFHWSIRGWLKDRVELIDD